MPPLSPAPRRRRQRYAAIIFAAFDAIAFARPRMPPRAPTAFAAAFHSAIFAAAIFISRPRFFIDASAVFIRRELAIRFYAAF
jgi:hypothetical protein